MKEDIFEFKSSEYVFSIGKNKEDNFRIIDESVETDIWFHVEGEPSCHVILKNVDNIRDIPKQVIKHGAYLCKINSKSAKSNKTTIMYTLLKNVEKTAIMGQVLVSTYKTINV
jgi:predicted ribosome quality control (RQC) complex YloA/Tae2 family protein